MIIGEIKLQIMANLQFYVDYAIFECFAKSVQHRRKYLCGQSTSNQVRSVYFQTANNECKDGYNSDAVFGQIIYEDEQGKNRRGDSIMVKLMERSEEKYKFVDIVFSNEIYTYSRIIPFFATFNKDILNIFPKFYYGNSTIGTGSTIDNDIALIILENLTVSGYRLTKLRTFLDIEELRLIVKNLAHFHAYSYYAKNKSPRQFYSIVSNLVETHYCDTGAKLGFLNLNTDLHLDILSENPQYSEKAELIRRIIGDADEFMRRMYTTAREPMAVVCHGDFLRNNLMIKYDAAENPVNVKFFDLACCRYCSPMIDLALILYMNMDQKTRNLYWDELIDVYCSSLREPFPDSDVPSKKQVQEEVKRNALNAFPLVAFFLPDMMRYDEIPDYRSFYRKHFLPEFAEFINLPWHLLPNYVEQGVWKKVHKPHHKQLVVDVLKDIIDRGFV